MLTLIGTKGTKGLKQLLKKEGFVSADEVAAQVEGRASQMVREAKLIEQYPDLSDNDTPFFKATAIEYGKLMQAGIPKGLAMEQAARNTRLAELEAGDGTPEKKTAEQERQRRIKAQGGDTGRRKASTDEGSDELTAEQKQICDSMGVSYDSYKKRAKDGVQFAGKA